MSTQGLDSAVGGQYTIAMDGWPTLLVDWCVGSPFTTEHVAISGKPTLYRRACGPCGWKGVWCLTRAEAENDLRGHGPHCPEPQEIGWQPIGTLAALGHIESRQRATTEWRQYRWACPCGARGPWNDNLDWVELMYTAHCASCPFSPNHTMSLPDYVERDREDTIRVVCAVCGWRGPHMEMTELAKAPREHAIHLEHCLGSGLSDIARTLTGRPVNRLEVSDDNGETWLEIDPTEKLKPGRLLARAVMVDGKRRRIGKAEEVEVGREGFIVRRLKDAPGPLRKFRI